MASQTPQIINQLVPTRMKTKQALQYITEFSEESFYLFAGQANPWTNSTVPILYDNPQTVEFNSYNSMLFGKQISTSDVIPLVKNNIWSTGMVFSMYDDADPFLVSNMNFFCVTSTSTDYYIWKCLDNNNGAPSTVAPQYVDITPQHPYYRTQDGYVWMYMYQISAAIFNQFTYSTSPFIPVIPDANVSGNAVSGSVDIIIPVDSSGNRAQATGAGYNCYYQDTFNTSLFANASVIQLGRLASQNTNFYEGCAFYVNGGTGIGQFKNIILHFANNSGTFINLDTNLSTALDATSQYTIAPNIIVNPTPATSNNVQAFAVVNAAAANGISSVQVVNPGSGIQYGTAYINISSIAQQSVSSNALFRVINSPVGGHGSNVYAELYTSAIGIGVSFANSESNTIPVFNDYQSVGILANPLFANVNFQVSNSVAQFSVGDVISQVNGENVATAVVVSSNNSIINVTNCSSKFVVSTTLPVTTNTITNYITGIEVSGQQKQFSTFVQASGFNGYFNGAPFIENQTVYSANLQTSNAVFYGNTATGNTIYLTNINGSFGPFVGGGIINSPNGTSSFTISPSLSFVGPDLLSESGEVLYMENFSAINRSNTQTESIQIVFQF